MYSLYRGLTAIGGPLIELYLKRREAAGKEDAPRRAERRGAGDMPRPQGGLAWIHAASVGESLSMLPLVERLLADYPDAHVLVTTGTVTSARLMADRLPDRAFHQYVPVDRPRWVADFLDHWKPDAAIWAESEYWPNLLVETGARDIPAVLVNARMSEKSFKNWRRMRSLIGRILGVFDVCLAQNAAEADRLKALGARDVRVVGNLKYASSPLPVDADALKAFTGALGNRPCWQIASTHAGEDEQAISVHAALRDRFRGLLTVIVPRHPERGAEIAALCKEAGLTARQRSNGDLPDGDTEIYIADTMGETGLFYRAVPLVCIGGSLVSWGGHNPIEPAQLGCCILYGPHMHNFATISRDFEDDDAVVPVAGLSELQDRLAGFLAEPDRMQGYAKAAEGVTAARAGVLDDIMAALAPLLAKSRLRGAIRDDKRKKTG